MKLNVPKNFGKMEEVPPVKRWRVVDSVGNQHEFDAAGFNPDQTGMVHFFVFNMPGGTIIQSTEIMQRSVRHFYHPASIEVISAPEKN